MGIVGLHTERVSPPHDPETVFVLRTALAPALIEQAQKESGYEVLGMLARSAGPGAVQGLLEALGSGRDAEDIAEEMNAGPKAIGPGDGPRVGTGPPPEDAEDTEAGAAPDAPKGDRGGFDMDWAATKIIKSWSYRFPGGKKIPVEMRYVRRLDAQTRDWLHDRTWDAMQDGLGNVIEGND